MLDDTLLFEHYLICLNAIKNECPDIDKDQVHGKTLILLSYLYLGTKDVDEYTLSDTMILLDKKIKKQKIQ
jgi:hypothetical protein